MYEDWIIERIRQRKEYEDAFVRAVLPLPPPESLEDREEPEKDQPEEAHRGVVIIEKDGKESD